MSPQSLQPLEATVCEACNGRVYFQFRSSVACADKRYRIVYLRCPLCGHSATQLQEVVDYAKANRRVKTVFKYARR